MADLRIHTQPLDGIVREIYASLSEDMCFERRLRAAVGSALQSHISALHEVDLGAHRGWLDIAVEMGVPEFSSMAEACATRWAGPNLWIERGIPALLDKGYGTGEEVVGDAELIRSEYYQHFLKPMDVHFGLGINVRHNDRRSRLAIISVNRAKGAGPFLPDELALVEQLRPHLVNAYSIYKRLVGLRDAATSLRETFDRAPIGMLVLDAGGRLVEQNGEASRLLTKNAGIWCALDRSLRLANPSARAKFRDALSRLGAGRGTPMPECLVISKSGEVGAGSLVLHLCAFPASVSQVMVRKGRILGFLGEFSHHSEADFGRRVLRAVLNLTPMEATVAMSLREHNDPMHVALDLGLAISTVRTHLKHLFRKTGTGKQSELLRLIDLLISVAPH